MSWGLVVEVLVVLDVVEAPEAEVSINWHNNTRCSSVVDKHT